MLIFIHVHPFHLQTEIFLTICYSSVRTPNICMLELLCPLKIYISWHDFLSLIFLTCCKISVSIFEFFTSDCAN